MSKDSDDGTQTVSRARAKTKRPKNYKVILLNDDYTTMDFVVSVLESVFQRSPAEAVAIMLSVHRQGRGIAGIYPKQIAETKAELARNRAQQRGFPLQCSIEED